MRPEVREAAEIIIGNLSEDGYLIASDEELLGTAPPSAPEVDASIAANVVKEATALGLATDEDEAADAVADTAIDAVEGENAADIPALTPAEWNMAANDGDSAAAFSEAAARNLRCPSPLRPRTRSPDRSRRGNPPPTRISAQLQP